MSIFCLEYILQKSNLNLSLIKWKNLKWTNKKERREYILRPIYLRKIYENGESILQTKLIIKKSIIN